MWIPNLSSIDRKICFQGKIQLALFRPTRSTMWNYLNKKHLFNLADSKQQQHQFHAIPSNDDIDTTQVRLCFQVLLERYYSVSKGKLKIDSYCYIGQYIIFVLFQVFLIDNEKNIQEYYINKQAKLGPSCSHIIACSQEHERLWIENSKIPIVAMDDGII